MRHTMTRRTFARSGAAAVGLAAAVGTRALGANDRIRLGFIGVGNRGQQLQRAFLAHDDAQAVVFCDAFEPYLERARQNNDGKGETCIDFRKVLERKAVDAVVVATPDHWHAIQTVDACEAGKDVYVEKPLSITIHEGRRMVAAARRTQRVVQVGLHRRASSLYARLAEQAQGGAFGKITVARAYRLSNMFPKGIGKAPEADPPKGLHWDLWLGPRPKRPFKATIAPYKFRWWPLYSSQVANWGVHYIDAIRWVTGELAPVSISAHGGRFAVDDDREIPDTMEAIFEFASGRLLIFGQYEASGNRALRSGEIELRGTQGTLYVSSRAYEVVPERGGQFQDRKPRMEPARVEEKSSAHDLGVGHARDFLDCIRSRKRPRADVEVGHRSTTFALLANIALATRSRIEWDPKAERITSPAAANALLHYAYRKPWVLR